MGVNSSASSLRSLVGISSGPIALCTWRLESSLYTPSLVTLMLSIEGCVLVPMSGIVDVFSFLLKQIQTAHSGYSLSSIQNLVYTYKY